MTEPLKLSIDGVEITAKPGQTVLQAAIDNNVYIPYLCYWPGLKPYGSCRMCVVEVEGGRGRRIAYRAMRLFGALIAQCATYAGRSKTPTPRRHTKPPRTSLGQCAPRYTLDMPMSPIIVTDATRITAPAFVDRTNKGAM